MKCPPLGPGGEDITWPNQVAPRGRKASRTRKIKPQTSNLKAAPHAKAREKPPSPKPLHPPLKLDMREHTLLDKWATHYIIPHTTTRKNDAAKINVTRHRPHTTQVYELTAPNVLVTHRRHDERYTIQAQGTAATLLHVDNRG